MMRDRRIDAPNLTDDRMALNMLGTWAINRGFSD